MHILPFLLCGADRSSYLTCLAGKLTHRCTCGIITKLTITKYTCILPFAVVSNHFPLKKTFMFKHIIYHATDYMQLRNWTFLFYSKTNYSLLWIRSWLLRIHTALQRIQKSHLSPAFELLQFVCLFVCLTGRPCGTRLGPSGPDSSKSSSQAKKPI